MKYNFDKIIDRKNTLSCKWDECKENGLPMWIADMDFEVAPKIKEALINRVNNGIFGYSYVPDEYYEAIISWWKRRYNFEIKKEWIIFSTGVIASISSMVRRLTHPNDNVVLLTPIYNTFYNSILNNGARSLDCPLIEKDGLYYIDFEDLEKKLSLPTTTLMIFCNPQNPTGNIWSKEDMEKIGQLCFKHNVTIISDEIHCDLTSPNYRYIPFASVNELNKDISITCLSPGKSFNLAGINSSCMVIKNKRLFDLINRGLNNDECAEPNAFAIPMTIAAYNESEDYLDELRIYIEENRQYFTDEINRHFNGKIKIIESHATYLLWVDVRNITFNTTQLCEFIEDKTGLKITSGENYHQNGFVRINIACPRQLLIDGINRFVQGIELFMKEK